jgi:hypothetical protein
VVLDEKGKNHFEVLPEGEKKEISIQELNNLI